MSQFDLLFLAALWRMLLVVGGMEDWPTSILVYYDYDGKNCQP